MRYTTRTKIQNNSDLYEDLKEERGLVNFTHYSLPEFKGFDPSFNSSIINISYVWKNQDHFYKLANQYYRDPKLWWVIAFYNNKPTEQSIEIGETILIPTPIEIVLQSFKV